jgi:hypothetical protein
MNPETIKKTTMELFRKLFGVKGNISKTLADMLWKNGIQLLTAVKGNMKQQALSNVERILLRKH